MADRPYVSQVVQIGPEATPNIPVAATKRLQSLRIVPNVMTNFTKVTPMGFKYPTVVALGQEWTEDEATGAGTYSEFQYILSSLLGTPTITTPATGAHKWAFQANSSGPDTPQTYTIEVGDANFSERMKGALFTDWDLTLTRKEIGVKGKLLSGLLDKNAPLSTSTAVNEVQTLTMTGTATAGTFTLDFDGETTAPIPFGATGATVAAALNLLPASLTTGWLGAGSAGGPLTLTAQNGLAGLYIDAFVVDNSDMVGGTYASSVSTPGRGALPSSLEVVPILPRQGILYLDTVYGNLGTTQLLRAFQMNISFTGKYGPIWPIDRNQESYAATVELEPKTQVKIQLQADNPGRAILDNMRAGQVMYVRADYLGNQIGSSGLPYRITFDLALLSDGVGKFEDAEGVYVVNYTFQPVADATSGYAIRASMYNDQAAL